MSSMVNFACAGRDQCTRLDSSQGWVRKDSRLEATPRWPCSATCSASAGLSQCKHLASSPGWQLSTEPGTANYPVDTANRQLFTVKRHNTSRNTLKHPTPLKGAEAGTPRVRSDVSFSFREGRRCRSLSVSDEKDLRGGRQVSHQCQTSMDFWSSIMKFIDFYENYFFMKIK